MQRLRAAPPSPRVPSRPAGLWRQKHMPAVATQQLAMIADLDTGPATAAMVQALAMFDAATKNAYLRRGSAYVLAAYAIRFGRTSPGASFVLTQWGDLTIWMTVATARWLLISARGYNPESGGDVSIKVQFDEAKLVLDEISDITNRTPRSDPDATDGTPAYEELGSLASSEGGAFDEADSWAQIPGGPSRLLLGLP